MNGISKKEVKILIVEDSEVASELLNFIFSTDPIIKVIGIAKSGEEAFEKLSQLKPDVITMDINLPGMNGFEATRRIMETQPVPIVVVTGNKLDKEVSMAMKAMEAGAVAIVQKPKGIGNSNFELEASKLIQTVKVLSEVKVVKRWARLRNIDELVVKPKTTPQINLIAIGASTGGPAVIQTIISSIPKDFPVPILIVQHMMSGFIGGFVDWLNNTSSNPVSVAKNDITLVSGNIYVAPDDFQMKLGNNRKISLIDDKPENGLRPSVSYLFRSVSEIYGKNSVGILLTGMGKDGALELKLMRDKGAITIVQDRESSAIHGMPGEAIRLGAAMYILPPEKIATLLSSLVNNK